MTDYTEHFFQTFEARMSGTATPSELCALHEHALRCPSCALQLSLSSPAARAGLPKGNVRPHERMRNERAVNLAMSTLGGSTRRLRRPVWVVALLSVFGTSLAAAAVTFLAHTDSPRVIHEGTDPSEPALVPTARPNRLPAPPAKPPAASETIPEGGPPPGSAATTRSSRVEVARAPRPEPRAAVIPVETAASLFSHANRLRRLGDDALAVGLYNQLQSQFAGSAEARQSHITLGYLHLDRGEALTALVQFNAYVDGGGPALQDALVGRSRALERLGQRQEERRTLERLIQEFPDSLSTRRAKARLSALQ